MTGVPVPLPPPAEDPAHRALLILLLLARHADLPPEEVVSPLARALAVRGLARSAVRRHRATSRTTGRPWMCRQRWAV
jgi:hypothetical protein